MSIVKTDLRVTRERAAQVRFYPVPGISATNVQDAVDQLGAQVVPTPTTITPAVSPYTPLEEDTVLLVDTTAGPVTIQMPLSSARVLDLEVKDVAGTSAVNAISVVRAGAETIDGLTTYTLNSPYASAKFGVKAGGYYVHA